MATLRTIAKNQATKPGTVRGFNFRGVGASTAFRGAANRAVRAGHTPIQARLAGQKAEQAYAG